ncbi:tripartite tricarboxylate transporter TctB family protein [Marinobacterium ramblicola]|uniref:tripartite tricarboxylate transporter TctB family protein n=1 Tax=Marinobacterium ramblicola TaxID=2849041 RepID=UPI001FE6C6CD|nr:tripartite tricarboxylate transporter TctB family protein [Marinobacterium ramblicola]
MNNDTLKQLETPDSDGALEDRSYGIYWFLLLVSLVLLCLIPDQAAWVDTKRGWYTQPMIGSTLGLVVMAMFSLVRVAQSFKDFRNSPIGRGDNTVELVFDGLDSFRTALVSSLLFFLYIQSLELLGFMLSTAIFTTVLLWLSRLLNRTWLIANLLTVAALILIFRVGLHIWLPDAWLYSLLPDNLSDLANQYL